MFYQPQIELRPEEVLLYSRKSRTDDPLLTVEEVLANHEKILDEMAERHLNGRIPEENRFREVVSGETIEDRPEVKKVLSKIESPKYKAIMIVEVQRLSRGDLEDAGRLIKLLRYSNTLVITQHKIYNLQDEYDRDAFERELKRGNEFLEYQKKIMGRGRLLSVQAGNFIGSIPPFGYNKVFVQEGKKKCPTLEINEYEATGVRMIFDLYVNHDMGRHSIAKRLSECGFKPYKSKGWNQDVVKGILTNPVYIGKVRWNWRKSVHAVEEGEIIVKRPRRTIDEYLTFDGKHDPIISEELFQKAQEKNGRNAKVPTDFRMRNPLASLVYCSCGNAMTYRTYKLQDGSERSVPRLICLKQHECGTSSCTVDEIMAEVRKVLLQCIDDFEIHIKNDDVDARKLHANLIKSLKAKYEELELKELRQWEKYSDEKMPKKVFDQLNEGVLKEKEEIQNALCKAENSLPEPVDYQEKIERFQAAIDALEDATISVERKNTLLKACIDRIEYSRGKSYRMTRDEAEKMGFKSAKGRWYAPPMELKFKLRL